MRQRIELIRAYMADLYTDQAGVQILRPGAKHCRIWLTSSMLP